MATEAQSATTSLPQAGLPFNPWRGACGLCPAEVVGQLPHKELGDGPKRVYEGLARFVARDGIEPYRRVENT